MQSKQIQPLAQEPQNEEKKNSQETVFKKSTIMQIPKLLTIKFDDHSDHINSINFANKEDEFLVLSTSDDFSANVYDAENEKQIIHKFQMKQYIKCGKFSPDNKYIALGSYKEVVFFNADTYKEVQTVKAHAQWVKDLAFSNDGKFFATCGDDKLIKIWDLKQFKEIEIIRGHIDIVNCLAFSPESDYFASGGNENLVLIRNTKNFDETGLIELRDHKGKINQVAFSSQKKLFASASDDSSFIVYHLDTKITKLKQITLNQAVTSLCFSNDGEFIAIGTAERQAQLYETDSFILLKSIQHDKVVKNVAFSHKWGYLATTSADQLNIYVLDEELQQVKNKKQRDTACCSIQ